MLHPYINLVSLLGKQAAVISNKIVAVDVAVSIEVTQFNMSPLTHRPIYVSIQQALAVLRDITIVCLLEVTP